MDDSGDDRNAPQNAPFGMPGAFGDVPGNPWRIPASALTETASRTGTSAGDSSSPPTPTVSSATSVPAEAGSSYTIPGPSSNVLRNRFAATSVPLATSREASEQPSNFDDHSESGSWRPMTDTVSSLSDGSSRRSSLSGRAPPSALDADSASDHEPAVEPPREETPPPPYLRPEEPQPAPAAEPIPPVAEEPQCRICLGGTEDCDELGPLIRPCRCSGTIKFVHVQCLNGWRTRSASRSAYWECPQCHFKYAFVRTRVVGLAESKIALSTMTIAIFILLVFVASAVVSFIFPDILYPELAAERLAQRALEDHPYGYYSSFGFGLGGWNFMTYDLTAIPEVISDFIRIATATFLDVEIDVGKIMSAVLGSSSPSSPSPKSKARPRTTGSDRTRYTSGRGPAASSHRLRTDSQGNVLSSRLDSSPSGSSRSFLGQIFARFMLGLSTLGIVSFLQLAMSMSLFAPLQIARGAWFRRRRRDGNGGGRGGVESAAAILIAVFVLIGVLRAMQQVYKLTVWLARQLLTRAETAILDVDGTPHYARGVVPPEAQQEPHEVLTLREQLTRWAAERAVMFHPRRLFGAGLHQAARMDAH